MGAALVIMAAGLGSRYGGCKQIDGIGPHGEILMEYSIYDALQAGFGKVVFIIKPDMRAFIEERIGLRLARLAARGGAPVEVAYACQDYTSLPAFYRVPEGRTKPYGTVHALLCAEAAVQEPFCVINADDYYGAGAYLVMRDALDRLPESGKAAMVGYLLKNTASLYGAVSRGLCRAEEGRLLSVQETKNIQLYPDGSLRDLNADRALDPETVVSMNFWGFAPSVFPMMRAYFESFLRGPAGGEQKSECLLPVMVQDELQAGRLEVSVLRSSDRWFGMTYREDRSRVSEELSRLHRAGAYPGALFRDR